MGLPVDAFGSAGTIFASRVYASFAGFRRLATMYRSAAIGVSPGLIDGIEDEFAGRIKPISGGKNHIPRAELRDEPEADPEPLSPASED
jgi:hypothetical protein